MGADDATAEFLSMYARSVELNGDVFFMASDADVIAEYKQLAQNRNTVLDGQFRFDDIDVLTKVMPPGGVERMFEHLDRREALQGLDGCYIADCDHHPDSKSPQAGIYYPTAITHGTPMSFSKGRLGLALEAFGAHGSIIITSILLLPLLLLLLLLLKRLRPIRRAWAAGLRA